MLIYHVNYSGAIKIYNVCVAMFFYPNVTTLRSGRLYLSQICLSSVRSCTLLSRLKLSLISLKCFNNTSVPVDLFYSSQIENLRQN